MDVAEATAILTELSVRLRKENDETEFLLRSSPDLVHESVGQDLLNEYHTATRLLLYIGSRYPWKKAIEFEEELDCLISSLRSEDAMLHLVLSYLLDSVYQEEGNEVSSLSNWAGNDSR